MAKITKKRNTWLSWWVSHWIIHWTESVFLNQNYEKQLLLLGDVQWLNVLWLSAEIFSLAKQKIDKQWLTSLKCNRLACVILLHWCRKELLTSRKSFCCLYHVILGGDLYSRLIHSLIVNYPTGIILFRLLITRWTKDAKSEVSNGLPMPSLWLVRWS